MSPSRRGPGSGADAPETGGLPNPEHLLVEPRAREEKLREALGMAQGEAYLGALAEDVPIPLDACHNVMRVCIDALADGPSPSVPAEDSEQAGKPELDGLG